MRVFAVPKHAALGVFRPAFKEKEGENHEETIDGAGLDRRADDRIFARLRACAGRTDDLRRRAGQRRERRLDGGRAAFVARGGAFRFAVRCKKTDVSDVD